MADVDDSSARICPIVKMVQKETNVGKRIFRVSWVVHNYNPANNMYHTIKKDKFFETEAGAMQFNLIRREAADILGLQEDLNTGHPMAIPVE